MRHQNGFSLLEFTFSIVVVGIIFLALLPLIQSTLASFPTLYSNNQLLQTNEFALNEMVNDLHSISQRNSSAFTLTQSNSLSFINQQGQAITYSFQNNQILRNNILLANNVSAPDGLFTYLDSLGTPLPSPLNLDNLRYIQISFVANQHTFTQIMFLKNSLL